MSVALFDHLRCGSDCSLSALKQRLCNRVFAFTSGSQNANKRTH